MQKREELAHVRKMSKTVLDQADCSGSHWPWQFSKGRILYRWTVFNFFCILGTCKCFFSCFITTFLISSKFYYIKNVFGIFIWIHLDIVFFILKNNTFCCFARTFEPLVSNMILKVSWHIPQPHYILELE